MDIGNIIKMRRLELGLTLEQVGKAVGVGKSTVRKWESGQIKDMRRDKIAALADALSISPAVLIFGDSEEPFPTNSSPLDPDVQELAGQIQQLDTEDRAEIRGEVRAMLRAEKYQKSAKQDA